MQTEAKEFPHWAEQIADAFISPEMNLEGCQDPDTGEWCLIFFERPDRQGQYLPLRLHHELSPEEWGERWGESEQWRIDLAFAHGPSHIPAQKGGCG